MTLSTTVCSWPSAQPQTLLLALDSCTDCLLDICTETLGKYLQVCMSKLETWIFSFSLHLFLPVLNHLVNGPTIHTTSQKKSFFSLLPSQSVIKIFCKLSPFLQFHFCLNFALIAANTSSPLSSSPCLECRVDDLGCCSHYESQRKGTRSGHMSSDIMDTKPTPLDIIL